MRASSKKAIGDFVGLVLVMLFVLQSVPVFAYNRTPQDGVIHHEMIDAKGGIVEQIEEHEGSIFYLRIADEYIYSSQLTPQGYYNFAFRYQDSYDIFTATLPLDNLFALDATAAGRFGRGDMQSDSVLLSSIVINNLHDLTEDVIHIEVNYYEEEDVVVHPESTPGDESAFCTYADMDPSNTLHRPLRHPFMTRGAGLYPSISALIAGDFHNIYFRTHLGGLTQSRGGIMGNTRMYETFTVGWHRGRSTMVWIGTTLSVASLLLDGWPAPIVRAFATFATGAAGAAITIYEFVLGELFVTEHYRRDISVNGNLRYGFLRDIRHPALSGSLGYQLDYYPDSQ